MENDKKDIDQDLLGIINIVDDKNIKKEVEEAKILDNVKFMKSSAISYFVNLFNSANEDDEIVKLAREQIKEKIPELSFSELRSLMNDFQKTSGIKNEQIISLFRANNQEISPLASILRDEASQDINKLEDAFKKSKKEDIQGLDQLSQLLTRISKSGIDKEED
jgi:hypothetical protein